MIKTIKKIIFCSLIIVLLMASIFSASSSTKGEEAQEVIEINGQKISYRDGGYVYINKEHNSSGGEFRGVWVSPLTGDIGNYVSKDSYQSQMLDVIKKMEAYNLNVMIFHVRIMNDAIYKSKYNYWSSYYNTNPDWDALPWLIEECHKHGIEFHAWMNPYRVTTNVSLTLEECAKRYKGNNPASNPNYLLKADKSIILNPGEPAVKEFLVDTCMELVENYDVDAIHFDDYFYASGIDDSKTIREYNTSDLNTADFRRKQVDDFIEMLHNELLEFNLRTGRRVQLGIAPTGVWSNGNGVVTYDSDGKAISSGSRTSAYAHYGSPLYADTLKWINNGWIDYILPQTYWAITNSAGPYCDLVKWWNAVCKNSKTNLYSSLGLYMSSGGNASWSTNHYEAYQQIMYANTLENIRGSKIYNFTSYAGAITYPDKAFRNVKNIWNKAIYLPEIRTMDRIIPKKVEDLTLSKNNYGNSLRFKMADDAKFYIIYRSENNITFDEEEIIDVIGNVGNDNYVEFTDSNIENNKTYYYGVIAQSNSLTLGEGVTISSSNIEEGTPITIGEVENVSLSEVPVENKKISFKFDKVLYPLGTTPSYEVYSSFYQNSTKISSSLIPITIKGSSCLGSVEIPSDATRMELKIKAFNDRGETIKIVSYDVSHNLGTITNFDIKDTSYYHGTNATFIWNNLNIEGVKYYLEYSVDGFSFNELEEIKLDDLTSFNLIYQSKLYGEGIKQSKNVTYRIKGVLDNKIAYSNSLDLSQYYYLGDINGIKINGDRKIKVLDVEEGDEVEIEWTNSNDDAIYTVQVSYDGKNWIGVSSYSSGAFTILDGNKYQCVIPIKYSAFLLQIKIVAINSSGRSESDVYTLYVKIDDLFSDEVTNYMHILYNDFIDKMNIYK